MIENGVIEVKVKRVLETILMTEILLILSIKIPALLGPDVLNPMMVVNWQRRGEAVSRIRSKLGLPHDRQRTIKSNKLTKKLGPQHGVLITSAMIVWPTYSRASSASSTIGSSPTKAHVEGSGGTVAEP
jgi:hypothetical protein